MSMNRRPNYSYGTGLPSYSYGSGRLHGEEPIWQIPAWALPSKCAETDIDTAKEAIAWIESFKKASPSEKTEAMLDLMLRAISHYTGLTL